jgi:hypothetical protein
MQRAACGVTGRDLSRYHVDLGFQIALPVGQVEKGAGAFAVRPPTAAG